MEHVYHPPVQSQGSLREPDLWTVVERLEPSLEKKQRDPADVDIVMGLAA